MLSSKIILVLFLGLYDSVLCQIQVPPAKLEAIYPKGLRVSIPDNGYQLFAFHGKLNEEMEGLEAGTWSRDITQVKNGRWTFRDRNAELKIGDKIYFWTYILKDGLGYRQDNGEWTVTGFVDEQGNPVDPSTGTAIPAPEPLSAFPGSQSQNPRPDRSPNPEVLRGNLPCELSVSKVSVPGFICKGQLLFEDNFNGDLKKGKIWTEEIMFPGEPDYPFNVYLNERNLRVRDGKLIIKPITLESKYGEDYVMQSLDLTARCTGTVGTEECSREASGALILPPVITAKVTTRNKFSFKYGRVEVRAKMPVGDWLVPLIQLEPRDNVYGNRNYASGVLRIASAKGNAEFSKKLEGGPIMCDSEPYRSAHIKQKVGYEQWAKDFHNYTLEWRPDGISLFVDGEKYGDVTPGAGFSEDAQKQNVVAASQWLKGTLMAPFDEMFYISIGLNVGGINDFPDSPSKPWKNRSIKAMLNFWNARDQWFGTWFQDTNQLQVEHVKVFAL
ncbi:hypothetical protein ABMA28_004387 [Loxostege sticticalis]|uniref:Beta-1,3-glucan recognition protein n=1 Tax=Loxostege sticticalis TaxID=481309 RepID=A0ABD0SRW7_LOXSC